MRHGSPNLRYESKIILDRRSPIFDILMAFIPFFAVLFNSRLGPLTPLLVFSVIPLYTLLRWEHIFVVLGKCWPLLLLPLLALTSTFWSDVPAKSLRYGILYLFTVIPAVLIGAGCNRDALLKGIFLAFAAYILLCIPFGRFVNWSGGLAYAGMMGSKNAHGDAAALAMLTSTITLFWAISKGHKAYILLALLIFLISAPMLIASRATGALVATIITLPCLLAWTASRLISRQYRTAIFVIAFFIVAILLATITMWLPLVFEALLESSGKDAGLTGRDILWRKADELIRERPLWGGGYNAFWVHNNLDAERLWRVMGIKSRTGFNFHNTPRDILVDLGFVGLALFIIVAAFAASKLILRTMATPDFTGIFFSALLVFESPRVYFELIGFQNMHFATLIVFVILSYGLRPRFSARARPL